MVRSFTYPEARSPSLDNHIHNLWRNVRFGRGRHGNRRARAVLFKRERHVLFSMYKSICDLISEFSPAFSYESVLETSLLRSRPPSGLNDVKMTSVLCD